MKKLIAVALCLMMMCAAVLPLTVSAAGVILMQDNFNEENYDNWVWEGTRFELIDGRIEGYAPAVVQQTNYVEDFGGNKEWGTGICFSVDAWMMDDDAGNGTNWLGIWWADYFKLNEDDEDHDGRIIYNFRYYAEDSTIRLLSVYEGEEALAYKPADEGEESDEHEWFKMEVPAKMDLSNPVKMNLGMRVDNGVISVYLDNQKVYSMNAERGTACGTGVKSPILLWNNGSYCAFDNFVVATADYNLFNESEETQAVVTEPATSAIVTEIIKEVETKFEAVTNENGEAVTDENGNAVTEMVTEIVTRYEEHVVTGAPSADTHANNGNGNGGAQTGDMFVIVAAVMAVALGAAIVVKKVND